jgi:phage virion morphogenesis protein
MITIAIDSAAVNNALRQLLSNVDDMTPAFNAIGEHIASLVDLNFRDVSDPYGAPWLPLKKPRKHPHNTDDRPLNDTGVLKNSITQHPTAGSVTIGTNVEYGKHHQFGTQHIPQRAFLPTEEHGLPDDWEQQVLSIIRRHIAASF